jgi:serpin B
MKKLLPILTLITASLLSDGISKLGWDLFEFQEDQNTIYSPYSIYSCLAMTAEGARGKTHEEMKNVLTLDKSFSFHPEIKMTNALWVAPHFFILPYFQQTIEKVYLASVHSLDFQNPEYAASTINSWIADQTDQKITGLIEPNNLNASTRLVLTNTLYYSGEFLYPFNLDLTCERPFWSKTETKSIPMMETTSFFLYHEDEAYQTVCLPFKDSQIALVIKLPLEKKFENLAPQLSFDELEYTRVHVVLPKFTLKQRLDLKSALSTLGMETAFTPSADFSGINGNQDLYLSQVLHEAYFSLDESGVVAAGATAAAINCTCVPTPPTEFLGDHPFVFALIDLETKTPLFLGEFATP